jgi:hypothetical protein
VWCSSNTYSCNRNTAALFIPELPASFSRIIHGSIFNKMDKPLRKKEEGKMEVKGKSFFSW